MKHWIILAASGLAACASPSRDLALCDASIREKVATQSTYRRISHSVKYLGEGPYYTITYELTGADGASRQAQALCYESADHSGMTAFP